MSWSYFSKSTPPEAVRWTYLSNPAVLVNVPSLNLLYMSTLHVESHVRAFKVRRPYPSLAMFPVGSPISLVSFCTCGLCPFSGLVWDLLPRWLFWRLAKGALPEEYLSHNLEDEHCLEDTGPCGALPTSMGRHHNYMALGCLVVWKTWLLGPVSLRMHTSPQNIVNCCYPAGRKQTFGHWTCKAARSKK